MSSASTRPATECVSSSATTCPSRPTASPTWTPRCSSWQARRWRSVPDGREPRIRGTGHPLPFSKGRMATNLFLSGVEAEHAYELALDIERAVQGVGSEEIALAELHSIVEDVLSRADGPPAVERYRAWQKVLRRGRPLGLVLGGAPRTGKSSPAPGAGHPPGGSPGNPPQVR